MKTYIKVWAVIILVANILVFGYLTATDGDFIKCNKTYKKVYPCHVIGEVTKEISPMLDNSRIDHIQNSARHKVEVHRRADDEPGLIRNGRLSSDMRYIGELLFILNAVLIGTAILLYLVIVSAESRRYILSSLSTVLMVAFLVGAVYGWHLYYKTISRPGEITEYHYNAPIIYLYDDLEREATVKLDLNGQLTCTYPLYNEETGWIVKTSSNGVLTDRNGRQYEYLYWEADVDMDPDLSKGFCVRGEDSAAFLEKALSDLGLTDIEANAFIMYWLPQLEENEYNIISFQSEAYENVAKLDVDPLPDTVVRVNMLFCGSDEYVEMEEQDLSEMNPSVSEREGFVLVEWGGGKIG